MNESRITEVNDFIIGAHCSQNDLQGAPYHRHRLRGFGDESTVILALIHDVAEDVADGALRLLEAPLTEREYEMAMTLTMSPAPSSVDYTEFYLSAYISAQVIASHDPRVLLVKMADTLHNSDPERATGKQPRDFRRLQRYRSSLEMCLVAYEALPNRFPDSEFSAAFLGEVANRLLMLDRQISEFEFAPTKSQKSSGPTL
jgi:hypothetical protein